MAATTPPKTMAEVLASSMLPLNNSIANNSSKIPGNSGYSNNGGTATAAAESKEESDSSSSNVMIKTYPFLTITVYIPTACVGVLIGKRGSNIDSIQKLAAKESTKLQTIPRGARNKFSKQNKNHGGNAGGNNPKPVSPDSVRISVVNYPPPPSNTSQSFDQHYSNLHSSGIELGHTSSSGQQQQQASGAMMDMGVPPTYTELDFSDPQWTPIVIRADPIAAIYAATAIHDVCCPEYVVDRNQLVYIMDVPVPAIAPTTNANLRHASIVGKRGNKLIQLSADHKCRIMVPPKQLGHDVIQLEAPLKECCSCLKAITGKLQIGGSSDDKETGDATKTSPSSPPAKNAKNSTSNKGSNNNGNKNNKNDKNSFQTTLIIQPLPSQTKLRNIARKTETKILKKRIPKSQQRITPKQTQAKPEQDIETKQPPEQPSENGESADQPSEKQEAGEANNNTNENTKISWRLTVLATTEKKVMRAVDMLKVLNSKGYEVIVEEATVNNNSVDTSNKSLPEGVLGGSESDADMTGDDTAEMSKPASATNGHGGGRGGGRGGRNKKQRHRNNYKGNIGKDNNANSKQQQTPPATPTAAGGE